MAVASWLREQRRVYFGNASSVRDYRAQLRGYKPALMWAIYLGLLILFAMMGYSSIVGAGELSISDMQNQLQQFFSLVFMILEVMVALVAPVIVAMSIQGESQRRSLDLVMTAPVSPKYYLVGKVLSGYRYIIMLLFLSLPITSAAVVLGGATWGEVMVSYLLLAMHGLLFIGLSLPIAVLCDKVISTVLYSYLVCWGISLTSLWSGALLFMFGGGGMGAQEMPFMALVVPGSQTLLASTYTTMFGKHVPNWILATLTILLIVKFLMLCAGSAMTRKGASETKSLRIHALLLAFLIPLASTFSVISFTSSTFGSSSPVTSIGGSTSSVYFPAASSLAASRDAATTVAWSTIFLLFALPYIACWSYFDDRKRVPDGVFKFRRMLTGAPEGGLPFVWALVLCVALGIYIPEAYFQKGVGAEFWLFIVWLLGAWTFLWSTGWLASSLSKTGVSTARKSHVGFTIIVALLPWPILGLLSSLLGSGVDVFQVYPLLALRNDLPLFNVVVMAVEFWALAGIAVLWAEKRRKTSYPIKIAGKV